MNMTRLTRAGIRVCAAFLALAAQPSHADIVTRAADGVTRIVVKVPGDLQIRYGESEKLTIDAEAKVLSQLDIAVKGDTLTLASKGSFKTDKTLKFTLTLKSFRSLRNESSGDALVENFSGADAEIRSNGSGDIKLKNMKPGRLAIVIDGSGSVEAGGSGKSVSARINGSGSIDASGFKAQVVEARIEGSGDIRVHADETLKAVIGGAGNIEYKGKAKVIQSVTGAGSVERI